VVREQTKVELRLPKSEDDIKAERLTDADIRKYWDAEEKKRIAPRGRHLAPAVEDIAMLTWRFKYTKKG
jgi:hypothetical protein